MAPLFAVSGPVCHDVNGAGAHVRKIFRGYVRIGLCEFLIGVNFLGHVLSSGAVDPV